MKRVVVVTCGILIAAVIPVRSQTGQDVVQRVGMKGGVINWSANYIQVQGSGACRPNLPPAVCRQGALRAATVDAQRNLLEVVKGVQVTSETTVSMMMTQSDVIRTRVRGVVRGAVPVGEPQFNADGSVTITMRMPVFGNLSQVVIQQGDPLLRQRKEIPPAPKMTYKVPPRPIPEPPPAPAAPTRPTPPEPSPARPVKPSQAPDTPTPATPSTEPTPPREPARPAPARPAPPPDTPPEPPPTPPPSRGSVSTIDSGGSTPSRPGASGGIYSTLEQGRQKWDGLVIDARKQGAKPAMLPVVYNESGSVVYSRDSVDDPQTAKKGIVGYAKEVDGAKRHYRVAQEPLIVPAVDAHGTNNCDVVISDEAAHYVQTTEPYSSYLRNGRVMIVFQ